VGGWKKPALVALFLICAAGADKPSDPNSKTKELIARAPFDRITLVDDSKWEVEPIDPRPLPPYDPTKKPPRRKVQLPHGGNIGLPGEKSRVEEIKPGAEDEEPPVVIHLLDGDVRDYKVKREHIKSVLYFEDMLIAEANRLTAAGEFARAFEYLLMVKSRQAKWPGLEEAVDRLLFEEGGQSLVLSGGEGSIRLLGELYRRRPDYPGLADRLAGSTLRRIKRAFDLGAFAAGREALRELESLAPDNPAVAEAHKLYETKARELLGAARSAPPADRLDLVLAAASVWPKLDGLGPAYREAFAAMPTLDVAVADVPEPVGPWLRSAASARTAPLLYRPLLLDTSDEALQGTPPGQLAARVESFDLSRGLRIKVRPGFRWDDGSRPVSAIDVARSLADRAVPTVPAYSARWADLLDRVEATDDETVELRLTRPCFRPERWLLAPVGPAHGGGDGWVSTVGKGRRPVCDGAYGWAPSPKGVAQFVANGEGPKVRRIREVRHDSPTSALAALVRGEVSLLDSLAPDRIDAAKGAGGIKVGRYATPGLHRIALDGRVEALRNRNVRRALSLAIDRKTLLEDTILRRPADAENAVSDGPFLKGTYADAPGVAPLPYDPWLAHALVAAARKEMGGGVIRLTFEYPPTAEAQAVAPKLAAAWRAVGFEVVMKEVGERALEARLRSGGAFELAYRAGRPGEPAFEAGPAICPAYDAPPSSDPLASLASPRILQLLLQLDRAPETTAAQALLVQIDRESRDELPILPLWQVVDHYAWRDRLTGVAEEQSRLYQGVETWQIEPWFPPSSR
jgi:peptide/nickel transport system substrate-binding protein